MRLIDFIYEALDNESVETNSNVERRLRLINYLKGKNYKEYIKTLNDMLKDDKCKMLLQDGFGGELGDMKLRFNFENIKVTKLIPTQKEIDIIKTVNLPIAKPEILASYFNDKVLVANTPLVTFRSNYIIDGHHRWSAIFAFNPEGRAVCCNYDSDEISSRQMLKATQGAIAAVKAQHDKDEIPQENVKGQNLFDKKWNRDAVVKYLKNLFDGKVPVYKGEPLSDKGEKFVAELGKYVKGIDSVENAIEYIADNLMTLRANNTPESDAPQRGDMPQTNQAGSEGDSKNTSVNDEDSALNKLKSGKIVKDAIK